jgi:tRNA (uracil-5-)-methyltransferase
MHSCARVLEVVHPNVEMRDESRIRCKYFGTCGGCQYQAGWLFFYFGGFSVYTYPFVVDAFFGKAARVEERCDCQSIRNIFRCVAVSGFFLKKKLRDWPTLFCFVDTGLPESSIPTIEETVESPLVYGYRTKITPHFERPPKHVKAYDVKSEWPDWLKIGFNITNGHTTMDIEVSPNPKVS